jgi:hypothetical protein
LQFFNALLKPRKAAAAYYILTLHTQDENGFYLSSPFFVDEKGNCFSIKRHPSKGVAK